MLKLFSFRLCFHDLQHIHFKYYSALIQLFNEIVIPFDFADFAFKSKFVGDHEVGALESLSLIHI